MSGKKRILTVTVLSGLIFVILISGCTTLNFGNIESTPVTTTSSDDTPVPATPQSSQQVNTKPSVSWKDFYPEHDEQTKQRLIEEAKDEIMRLFPYVDKTTLNGNWIEQTRINPNNNLEEIGRPYINFENSEYTSGEGKKFKIRVDPELMRVIYYAPNINRHNPPVISSKEGKVKAIDIIKKAQGEDSLAYDSDAYRVINNIYGTVGLPFIDAKYYKKYQGVICANNYIWMSYDMSRDKVSTYMDYTTHPKLLSGLMTLSPEPDITLDEAIKIYEDKIPKKYDLDDLELEYSKIRWYDSSLVWLDDENFVYADDPNPIPLVWFVGCSNKKSRQEALERGEGEDPLCGSFQIDAHTGEIYLHIYDNEVIVATYGHWGPNPS